MCSQDKELRAVLGSMPGHPLFYFNQVTLVMEPPSQRSLLHSKQVESDKSALSTHEKSILESLGLSEDKTEGDSIEVRERKKRKAVEANPLSVLPADKDSKRSKRRKLEKLKKKSR